MPNEKKLLSLHPLKFDEAVTDILKIKPMPKAPKKTRQKTRTPNKRQPEVQSSDAKA